MAQPPKNNTSLGTKSSRAIDATTAEQLWEEFGKPTAISVKLQTLLISPHKLRFAKLARAGNFYLQQG